MWGKLIGWVPAIVRATPKIVDAAKAAWQSWRKPEAPPEPAPKPPTAEADATGQP